MKKSHIPKILPLENESEIKLKLMNKVIEARLKIKELDILIKRSVVEDFAITFFYLNESIQSTKIEGTQTTFDEMIESKITGKDNDNIQEVNNYIEALNEGKILLNSIPISTRLFHTLHKIILNNSRGENRNLGEYRKIQNFIGPTNNIKGATYIPPEPQLIDEYMQNLEKYINEEENAENLDPLLKAGIIHAQFETIHPYLDGNGRLGRILIMLYLLDSKVIDTPSFFISDELEKNKYKYYALLNDLRTETPNWINWLEFFLDSSIRQAKKYSKKLKDVEEYYNRVILFASDNKIHINVIRAMFKNITFTLKNISDDVEISYNTLSKHVDLLVEGKFLYPDDKKRNTIYRCYDLLDILR